MCGYFIAAFLFGCPFKRNGSFFLANISIIHNSLKYPAFPLNITYIWFHCLKGQLIILNRCSVRKQNTNWNPKYPSKNISFRRSIPTLSQHGKNAEPAQHREGKLHFCLNLEDLHGDAFFLFHTTVLYEFERQCLYLFRAMEQCYT